jgi:hypothetical protein
MTGTMGHFCRAGPQHDDRRRREEKKAAGAGVGEEKVVGDR